MFKFIFSFAIVIAGCGAYAQGDAGKASAPVAAQAEDGASVMKRACEKVATYKTAKGSLQLKGEGAGDQMEITFSVMKPNFLILDTAEFEVHNSGTDTILYSPKEKVYTKLTPEMQQSAGPWSLLVGLEGLFSSEPNPKGPFQPQGKAKTGFFRGVKAIIVQLSGGGGEPILLYINADSLAPIAFTSPNGKNTAIYKDLTFDSPMKAEDFAWSPPADAKSMPDMGGGGAPPPKG